MLACLLLILAVLLLVPGVMDAFAPFLAAAASSSLCAYAGFLLCGSIVGDYPNAGVYLGLVNIILATYIFIKVFKMVEKRND